MTGDKRRGGRRNGAPHRGRPSYSARVWSGLAGRSDYVTAAGYFTVLALFAGGLATWSAAYALVCAATFFTAGAYAWRDGFYSLQMLPTLARVGVIGVAVLPLLQLLPLPPSVWHMLPGQELRRGTLILAGQDNTWQPLTLEPASTALAAVLGIGFLALVGLMLRISDAQFRRLLTLAIALTVAGIAVGLLQVLSNGWPFLQVRNMGGTMLGFMANKNHMALQIACVIVLSGLLVGRDLFGRERGRIAGAGFAMFALVCIVTTNSRAGLVLGGVATVIVLADLVSGVALRWRMGALALLTLVVLSVVGSDAFEVVGARVGDVDEDLRWAFLQWSRPLVEQYWVLGSGLGSFATLFAAHEQMAWLKPTFVNAVHNDYVQLILEAGLPGTGVMLMLVLAVLGRVPAWRTLSRRNPRRTEMAAGFAVLLLFVLHSFVDYPLRRPAAWIFAALAFAAVMRPLSATNLSRGTDPA